jgi:hypothetical protein
MRIRRYLPSLAYAVFIGCAGREITVRRVYHAATPR